MDSTLQALIIALGIIALAGLSALIESLADRRAWLRREASERVRTTGILVGFDVRHHHYRSVRHRKRNTVTVYYPIVVFQADGVEYRLKSVDTVPRKQYREGQPVDLLYDSEDPTRFHLDLGGRQEQSTRDAVVIALIWLAGTLTALAVLVLKGNGF